MSVQSGQSVTVLFTTRVFSTGVGTNADSLPTGTLYVNGTANAATVTVTNISTGLYKAQVTLPTLSIKDEVQLSIAATVSAISDTAVIWGDTKDIALDSSGDVTFNNTSIATVTTVGTLTTYTGNTPQTGDAFARLGVAGVGLTNLGDTRIANLDTNVGSRMATYTQPTGFLAATFPTTIASTTNITGGTITTTTNLTNSPTSGDFTATMKTSIGTAVAASAVASVTAPVVLASNGLDLVLVESGISASSALTIDSGTQLTAINARQALSLTISMAAAVTAGAMAGSSTITFKPAALPSGNTRITSSCDTYGNRTGNTLKVPT